MVIDATGFAEQSTCLPVWPGDLTVVSNLDLFEPDANDLIFCEKPSAWDR